MSDTTKSAEPLWMDQAEQSLPQASLRRVAILSLLVVVVGLGSVLTWASLASVDSAVPASGVVVASGKRKTITLLEGGILHELLVHEGDQVVAGQVLLRLDDVQVRATRDQAKAQYWSAIAKMTRLAAEAIDQRDLTFPTDLREAATGDPAVAAAMSAELHQFQVRWDALDASVRVQERKIAQQQAQIGAIRAQIASVGTRLSLTQEELQGVNFLMSRGLSTKPRQLDLLRTEADMRGQVQQSDAQLTQAMQMIAQIELETINTAESRRADISRERAETQSTLSDADQRLRAAADQLEKREIISPESGTITDLKYFTVGSSIAAGQPIMDLVPSGQHLLIEGNVAPERGRASSRRAAGQCPADGLQGASRPGHQRPPHLCRRRPPDGREQPARLCRARRARARRSARQARCVSRPRHAGRCPDRQRKSLGPEFPRQPHLRQSVPRDAGGVSVLRRPMAWGDWKRQANRPIVSIPVTRRKDLA